MPSALGYGLMGAAMGGLQGAHQAWQQEQQNIQTERLLAARRLEAQELAKIEAQYKAAKDEKDHEQALELEGVKAGNREKIEGEKISAADRRAAENNASRERSAAVRASSGSAAKPSFRTAKLPDGKGWGYVDPATGKFSKNEDGSYVEAAPPYRERQGGPSPSGGKSTPPPAAPDPLEPVFVPPPAKGSKPIGPRTRADVREQVRPVTSDAEAQELMAEAKAAMARGADPIKVRARLQQFGLTLKD
jgi:hypothetical protein